MATDALRTSPRRLHTALVADIGGTNARLAVADLDTLRITGAASFRGAEFPSLHAVAGAYLGGIAERPPAAAVAVAAPVVGRRVSLTNSPWSFEHEELRAVLGVDRLLVLNDFEALAHVLPHLERCDLHQIGGGTHVERGHTTVLGPGTGLGDGG